MDKPPLIRRVVIHNYKSIAKCDVTLGKFNVLVGRNGSGKSNFLDALQFVSDAVSSTLSSAIDSRNGMQALLRRGQVQPKSFRIYLEIQLSDSLAEYDVEIASQPDDGFVIHEESLSFCAADGKGDSERVFRCGRGDLLFSTETTLPAKVDEDRLYLPIASSIPRFRPVYEALVAIGMYNPIPDPIRSPSPSRGIPLRENCGNLASVVYRLKQEHPSTIKRIVEYIGQVTPGITGINSQQVGFFEFLKFQQTVAGEAQPRTFDAMSMSDGTIRALAILVAAMQFRESTDTSHLVSIEEPETALHPAAIAVLLEGLREASVNSQILITTHSPDLLDRIDLETDNLFAVSDTTGSSVIEPIDDASSTAIKEHLYTAGELQRMDQLEPRYVHDYQEVVPE